MTTPAQPNTAPESPLVSAVARAAAEEIISEQIELFGVSMHEEPLAAIIARHVAPLVNALEAAEKALKCSAELLDEVRTGEDFEVTCWDGAEQARMAIAAIRALKQPGSEAKEEK